MRGTKIPKYKKMSMGEFQTYNKPEQIYIPIVSDDITVLVKKGDYVQKGSVVAHKKGNLKVVYHSSVSGNVKEMEEMTIATGEHVKCIVIENDYKEQSEKRTQPKENILEYTKQEFLEIIKGSGIIGLGGAGFPTYFKYDTKANIKTLIVNAVECEPYITADNTILLQKCEEILATIDAIMEINEIDESFIAIKKDHVKTIRHIETYIGTYPKIKLGLVPNLYPMGWEKNLVQEIKHVTYDTLPIEQGIVVNNVSTVYAMYEALTFEKPLMERIITFSGSLFVHPMNVLVKIGTPVRDIISSLTLLKQEEVVLIAGGPMMGVNIETDDLIVTPQLNSVLAVPLSHFGPTLPCIHCGKCVDACPSKLSPVLIKEQIDNLEQLKLLCPLKCIECGLCSYVCPSKIPVREFVRAAKKNIRGGREQ